MEHTQEKIRANFHWVTDDLATGGDLHHEEAVAVQQIEHLVEEGITHIIDMRMEWSDEALVAQYAPWIEYKHIRTNDASNYNIPSSAFDQGVAFARSAAEAGGKVLTHCHMGINRGPSMALAILLDNGWAAKDAYDLVREKRPIAGVAYAVDAVTAHILRTDGDPQELVDFIQYEQSIVTVDEVRRISGIIRGIRAKEGTEWH